MGIFDKLFGKKNKSFKRVDGEKLKLEDDLWMFNGEIHTGSVYRCWPKGNLIFETEVKNGEDHGRSYMFNVDGSIFGMLNFNNGVLSKVDKQKEKDFNKYMKETYPIAYKKHEQTKIKNYDINNRLYHEFHNNGRMKFEVEIINSKKNGFLKEWYENGQLMHEQYVTDDILDGICKSWFENGQLKYDGNFIKDKKNGLIQEWYESGQLHYRMNYAEGQYEGKLEKWYENGQLLYVQNWKNGKIQELIHYDEAGKLIAKKSF